MSTAAPVPRAPFPYRLEPVATLRGHSGRVWSAAWSPGGAYLLTTGSDGSARVWARRQQKSVPFTPLSASTAASSLSAGAPVASVPADVGVEPAGASAAEEFDCLQVLDGVHARTTRCGSWAPSGRYIALASFDRSISIWELTNGVFECIATLEGHQEGHEIKWVSWAPSGDLLASCSRDKSVLVWACDGGPGDWECCAALTGHTQDVKQVRFHPSLEMLLSSSYDGTARVWLPEEDEWFCAATLSHHTDTVWGLAFAPAAPYFATVSADRSLALCACSAAPADDEDGGNAEGADGGGARGGARAWPVLLQCADLHQRPILSVDWSRPADLSLLASEATGTNDAATAAAADAWWRPEGGSLAAAAGYLATGGGDDAVTVLLPLSRTATVPELAPGTRTQPSTVASELTARGALSAAPAAAAASPTAAAADAAAPAAGPTAAASAVDKGAAEVAASQDVQPSPFSAPYTANFDGPRVFSAAAAAGAGAEAGAVAALAVAARLEGAHRGEVNCVVWHPKRRNVLATAGDDGLAKVWRLVPNV